jgi:hypothetical protein
MSKDSIAVINGHEYKYRYNSDTKLMDYLGPVGDAPALTQEQFREAIKREQLWDTKPIQGDREQQEKRIAFARKTLPYMLEATATYPLGMVNLSKQDVSKVLPMRLKLPNERRITVDNEDEIKEFLDRSGKFKGAGTAAFNKGFMTLYFVPHWSFDPETGEPLNIGKGGRRAYNKMLIYDLDFEELDPMGPEVLTKVKDIVKENKRQDIDSIVMFTGSSWQVWGRDEIGDTMRFGTYESVRDNFILPIAKKVKISTEKEKGKVRQKGKVTLDITVNSPNRPLRFFFSQHQKTGLVSVPVEVDKLDDFDPSYDAHPKVVLDNLFSLYTQVDKFWKPIKEWKGDQGPEPTEIPKPKKKPRKEEPVKKKGKKTQPSIFSYQRHNP